MNDQIKEAISGFRENMAFFGFPLSNYTDEEILDGAWKAAEIVMASTITVQEASDAIFNALYPPKEQDK